MKRDVRTLDHEPLHNAEKDKYPFITIYIFDEDIINKPDSSTRHLSFVYQSILDVNKKLEKFNKEVNIFYGQSIDIFKFLVKKFCIKNIYSYQETGTELTWKRDREVGKLLKAIGIKWIEFQRDGIVRGIKNRNGWNDMWEKQMKKKCFESFV